MFFPPELSPVLSAVGILCFISSVWWRLRQRQHLEQAKHEFMDLVSHELRTPLGSMRDAAAMLSAGDYGQLPIKARQITTSIHQAATRLLSLAETFLSASRLESGTYISTHVPADVRQEGGRILDELLSVAESKGLAFTIFVAKTVPSQLMLDREALHITLFNLIDNAIKYTSSGRVAVTCYLEDRHRLVCEVCDTGSGLTSVERKLIFDKFRRGSAAMSHQVAGSGLGLYIIKRLLEAAGGEITVESEGLGRGSKFRFKLPIQSAISSDKLRQAEQS